MCNTTSTYCNGAVGSKQQSLEQEHRRLIICSAGETVLVTVQVCGVKVVSIAFIH